MDLHVNFKATLPWRRRALAFPELRDVLDGYMIDPLNVTGNRFAVGDQAFREAVLHLLERAHRGEHWAAC